MSAIRGRLSPAVQALSPHDRVEDEASPIFTEHGAAQDEEKAGKFSEEAVRCAAAKIAEILNTTVA
jgi:hypothetical protein